MTQLNYYPLIRLIIPYALGIIWAFYAPFSPPIKWIWIITLSSISVLFLLYFIKWAKHFHNRWLFGAWGIITVFFLANLTARSRIQEQLPYHFNQFQSQTNTYVGTIISEPQQKANSVKIELQITQIKDSIWHSCEGKCLVYIQADSNHPIAYGDIISFQTPPSGVAPTQNFDAFNYKKYLWHHHIYHQVFLASGRWKKEGTSSTNWVKKWAITQRQKLLNTYSNLGFSATEFEIIAALTLGQKDALTSHTKKAYASAGAMHVLAVSGLHVGIVFLILQTILKHLGSSIWAKSTRTIILLFGVWLYALITGFSPSVIRAATMFSFMIMATNFKQHTNIYNTLAASALVILTIWPFMLFEVGFQLSYLAVIGIVTLHKPLYQLLCFNNWILDKAWSITCVSMAAQLATAPLGFLYFHQFPTYFFFSNLIVIPAAFAVLIGGILIQITQFIPLVNQWLATLLIYLIKGLNGVVFKLQTLPYSIIQGIDISVVEAWVMYLFIIASSIWLIYKIKAAFLIGLACVLILSISQCLEIVEKQNRHELTFYAVKNHTVIEYIKNNRGVILADSSFTTNENKMQFNVWHHWWKRGFSNSDFTPIHPKSSLSTVGKKKILIYDDQPFSEKKLIANLPDIIVLNTYKHWQLKDVYFSKCKIIILGTNCSRKTHRKASKLALQFNIPMVNMRQTGSIKLDFTKPKNAQLITQINR